MVKRKRNEPKLATQLEDFEVKLFRALKGAKGFERQRLAKRVREANPDKVERLEREVTVLKCLDLHQAAHAILCSHLLKIKGVAESPNLPEQIKPVPKPDITEDERTALHNVTSGLCNRKQVKDVLDEAVMTTCIALRVPMPDKKAKGKSKGKEDQEDQEKEKETKPARPLKDAGKEKRATPAKSTESDNDAEDTGNSGQESWEGLGSGQDAEDDEEVEKAISRYDALLGGSSDSEDGDDGDGSDEEDRQNSRSATFGQGKSDARGKSDYFSGSSAEEESDEDGGDEEDGAESDEEDEDEAEGEDDEAVSGSDDSQEEVLPPPKKARTKAAKAAPASNGNSTFLPSLMGGYISGSESEAEDLDDIAPKKNRRGQRARQAIWEKKFKEQAKHLNKPKDSRDSGWDPKRGAVEAPNTPWRIGSSKRPLENGVQSGSVHPDRLRRNFKPETSKSGHGRPPASAPVSKPAPKPAPEPKPKRDDTGSLHASWEAAKARKEQAAKAQFQGKKVTFD